MVDVVTYDSPDMADVRKINQLLSPDTSAMMAITFTTLATLADTRTKSIFKKMVLRGQKTGEDSIRTLCTGGDMGRGATSASFTESFPLLCEM